MTTFRRVHRGEQVVLGTLVALLAGCGSSSDLEMVMYARTDKVDDALVTMVDGRITKAFRLSDFRVDRYAVPSVRTGIRPAGEIVVTVELFKQVQSLAKGSATIATRPDASIGVGIHYQSRDPLQTCMGCVGGVAFASTDPNRTDSLYITWGYSGGRVF